MSKIYLVLYNALIIFALPLIVILFLFSKKYRKELFYKISERFACYNYSNLGSKKKTVWIHCASLGEVRAVEPILDNLRDDYFIVLTTLTKSGREYAVKLQKAALLPLDIYPIIKRAFDIVRPDLLVLVETEFWVSMLYTAAKRNTTLITVNGRISKKSFDNYKRLRFFWKKFVGLINVIIARSKEDADRFKYLTGEKSVIFVSGNIKYDRNFKLDSKREDFLLSEDDFIFSAGSTREGEEEIIADVFNRISLNFNGIKFFVAPRHLSRIKTIVKILKNRCIEYSLFSSGNLKNKFILVDVFGKLHNIYSI